MGSVQGDVHAAKQRAWRVQTLERSLDRRLGRSNTKLRIARIFRSRDEWMSHDGNATVSVEFATISNQFHGLAHKTSREIMAVHLPVLGMYISLHVHIREIPCLIT